jgi:hypothetical protein
MSSAKSVVAMPRPLLRAAIIAALSAVLVLVSGCSAIGLVYKQADSLAFRWLDRYAEFDDAQSLRVREAIAAWFTWHRRTQLPDYADLLTGVEADVLADTTAERLCTLWTEVRSRIDRGLDQAMPAIVDVAMSLKPAQLKSIEERFVKTNSEYRDEFMQADPVKRSRKMVKRIANRAEWLYGDLGKPQRERIEQSVGESPFDVDLAFDERRRRQQDSLQTLRRVAGGNVHEAVARTEIGAWLQRVERSPRDNYRSYSDRLVRHNCRMAADLHNSTTLAQRQFAAKQLKGWVSDLRALAADG